ncbi:aldo-keto reductase family 1 member A1-B-like [Diadema antillarum]|uniref:aldo-keto reductase family 1 member A1-B-like n=1 Tax=Diadema antillarum TaxID=105358 RepID=UPI003A8A916F
MDASVTIASGVSMPLVGLGTWKLKADEIERAIGAALDAGYRHIDCAHVYSNEKEVGVALKNAMKRLGLKREDVFVTSKLWNTFHAKEDVLPTFQQSLTDLQLDYLDLYLMHWPLGFANRDPSIKFPFTESGDVEYSSVHFVDTWAAMQELVKAGKCRAIGISNFNSKQIDEVIQKSAIPPAVLQVESHPYFPQTELLNFCRERGVVFSAYSPLGCGDRAWRLDGEPDIFDDPKIQKIAQKHGKTVAQVAIRFQVQRGAPVIPKSATPSRIQENIAVFDFDLSEDDMAVLSSLPKRRILVPPRKDKNGRPVVDASGLVVPRDGGHRFYPFHEPF